MLVLGVLVLACIICGTILTLQDHDTEAITNAGAALLGALIALSAVTLFDKRHLTKGTNDDQQA